MRNNKKSQITLFIIMGIVILFGFALFIFLREKVTNTNISAPEEIITAQTPQEIQPIKQYVEECLYQTTKDAFLIMGQNGGYISLDNKNINPINPTESEGFEIMPNQEVPYWYYMRSSNSCNKNCNLLLSYPELTGNSPTSIESQVEEYVNNNINNCLLDFYSFENQGYDITKVGESHTNIKIAEKDISIEIEYPLEINKSAQTFKLDKFNSKLDLNFKEIYEYSEYITNGEVNYGFMSSSIFNAINAYQQLDMSKIPPIDHTSFGYQKYFWDYQTVKTRLKYLLMDYTHATQINNTNNYNHFFELSNNKWTNILYKQMVWDFENKETDLNINFRYLGWPFYFYITPINGNKIEPTCISQGIIDIMPLLSTIIPQICQHKSAYDISYPVLIEVENPEAFNGEGYLFRYGIEINIRNNQGITIDSNNQTIIQEASAVPRDSIFCENKGSGNITITVKDKYTNEPIENAVIQFDSGRDSCYIGETNENGKLNSKFPTGYGILTIQKEEYGTNKQYYLTSLDKTDSLTIELYQTKEVPVEIYQVKVEKGWTKDDEVVSESTIDADAWENLIEECLLLANPIMLPTLVENFLTNQVIDWTKVEEGTTDEQFTIIQEDINHYKESRATWILTDETIKTLEEDEQIVINFAYQSDLDTGFFVEPIMINSEDITEGEKITAMLDLIPGRYLVTANIIKQMEEPYQIPGEKKCKDMICGQTSFLGADQTNCYEIDGQNLTSLVVGMYMTEIQEYDEGTNPNEIQLGEELPIDKIKNQKTLKIYIPKVNINDITSVTDLQVMGMFQEFAIKNPDKIGLIWG